MGECRCLENFVEPFIRVDLSSVICCDSLSLLHDELCVAAAAECNVRADSSLKLRVSLCFTVNPTNHVQ